ncbi:hypothetical protein [Acinetobacter ihumii]|uniref:hypothetical protein n=1 Tax=Acinetobacter ihumii TaxID=2483802 RepID=UPI001030F81F|nr:hypothetical protein [Acinetobacter ihumii]
MYSFSLAVQIGIVFAGIFLWIGMLTGVWKYYQIRYSAAARAHYYVDIAHRSSLLYAPASLILAVLAYFSVWSNFTNILCVVLNIIFFSFSIGAYIVHGVLKDTTNQFKTPHRLGKSNVPTWMMTIAMVTLIVIEVGATWVLLLGTIIGFGWMN